jgi:hypothetical protein
LNSTPVRGNSVLSSLPMIGYRTSSSRRLTHRAWKDPTVMATCAGAAPLTDAFRHAD